MIHCICWSKKKKQASNRQASTQIANFKTRRDHLVTFIFGTVKMIIRQRNEYHRIVVAAAGSGQRKKPWSAGMTD